MNTNTNTPADPAAQDERAITLPTLPEPCGKIGLGPGVGYIWDQDQMADFARAAVLADRAALPAQAVVLAPQDKFDGDDSELVSSINALLALDATGSLVPHGIGGLARTLLEAAASRLGTVADEPVGFVSAETLADLADPAWREQRGVSADLWGTNNPPSRAKIPLYARPAPVQDVAPTDARWTPVISSNPMLNPYPLPNIGDVVLVTVDLYPGTSADIKNRYYTGEARWSEKGWSRVYRDPDVLHGGAQVIGWTSMPAPIGAAAQPAAQPDDAQGLPVEQEPKYTTDGQRIVNRASGEAIPADEPVFIFRARDKHAREALEAYACVLLPGFHRDVVVQRVADFAGFSTRHPDRMKEPDTAAQAATIPTEGS